MCCVLNSFVPQASKPRIGQAVSLMEKGALTAIRGSGRPGQIPLIFVFLSSFKPNRRAKLVGMALVVRPSRIHSVGVFTTTPVRKGARIVEYAGPRITAEQADRLYDG